MSSIEISDDDDSFILPSSDNEKPTNVINISSSEEELPVNKKTVRAVRNLFPMFNDGNSKPSTSAVERKAKVTMVERTIGGVKVTLPIEPYGSQVALMAKVIKAMKEKVNCWIESPTGTGKTLALLCCALALQKLEREQAAQRNIQEYFSDFPELNGLDESSRKSVAEYIKTPKKDPNLTPEKLFTKVNYGHRSIYDSPIKGGAGDKSSAATPETSLPGSSKGSPGNGQVKLYKKRTSECVDENEKPPQRSDGAAGADTPPSMNTPTIYYGARTHKQLQQVIKEFERTVYCGEVTMSVLASRDHTCIREFDRIQWGNRNDMCRGCVKTHRSTDNQSNKSNCKYYDNREALNSKCLPPAFDIEDLVAKGEELSACPFYAARAMATKAEIVFCPYNYLLTPSIRESMKIDLSNNIVIVDEAHNVEGICRDIATFVITREQIRSALRELDVTAQYRFAGGDLISNVEYLMAKLKLWDDWFTNQTPLLDRQPVNDNEAVCPLDVEFFVATLNNHNIGYPQYKDFTQNTEMFCRKYRDDPRSLLGVTQATATLLDNINSMLSYLFREDCQFMDDFKPVLVRTVGSNENLSNQWRKLEFNKRVKSESVSLRMICLNPGVVFAGACVARSVVLASGTLTPAASLPSELGTAFPVHISLAHAVPSRKVWVGSLGGVRCAGRELSQAGVQDVLGHAVLQVATHTPHGVLVFLSSYRALDNLIKRWKQTNVWQDLNRLKHIFQESKNTKDHDDIMEDYYKYVNTDKGAILFAVYRGKVSEGMDFKDQQARAVIAIGIPYPYVSEMAVSEKRKYNDQYCNSRGLLNGNQWYEVQAYRALNQALGRCVRHRGDWGAVLLLDERYRSSANTMHISAWARKLMVNNNHTMESLFGDNENSLKSFMKQMSQLDMEDQTN